MSTERLAECFSEMTWIIRSFTLLQSALDAGDVASDLIREWMQVTTAHLQKLNVLLLTADNDGEEE